MDWSPGCAWLSQSASIYHLSLNLELQATGNYDRSYTSSKLLKYHTNFFSKLNAIVNFNLYIVLSTVGCLLTEYASII